MNRIHGRILHSSLIIKYEVHNIHTRFLMSCLLHCCGSGPMAIIKAQRRDWGRYFIRRTICRRRCGMSVFSLFDALLDRYGSNIVSKCR